MTSNNYTTILRSNIKNRYDSVRYKKNFEAQFNTKPKLNKKKTYN